MTECGPLVSYKGWSHPMIGNSGDIAAPTIEVRFDSEQPARIPGEIPVALVQLYRILPIKANNILLLLTEVVRMI